MTVKNYTTNSVIARKYTLTAPLRPSSTVDVWKCVDREGKEFAIKLFLDDSTKTIFKDKELRQKLKTLYSENLLVPTETGMDDGVFFVVMPYCTQSLFDKIKYWGVRRMNTTGQGQGIPLSETEAVHFIKTIFDGLRMLHGDKLVHLDIKPSNIMMAQNKSGEEVCLISDFDNLRDVDKTRSISELKEDHGIAVHYAAPEQFEENYFGELTSDIYSAGITIYEMLTCGGVLPYAGTRNPSEFQARSAEVTNALCALGYSPYLIQIVQRCLSYDKINRPTAVEVYNDCNIFLNTGSWPKLVGASPCGRKSLIQKKGTSYVKYLIPVLLLVSAFWGYNFFTKKQKIAQGFDLLKSGHIANISEAAKILEGTPWEQDVQHLLNQEFKDIGKMQEDSLFIVQNQEGKFGVVHFNADEKNKFLPAQFDQIFSFENGHAIVQKGDKFGLINKDCVPVIFVEENGPAKIKEKIVQFGDKTYALSEPYEELK